MAAKIKKPKSASWHSHPYKPKGINHKAFKKVYWPYIPIVLSIAGLLALGSSVGALSAIARDPSGNVLSYATSMSINGLLESTNSARSQNGISTLKLNSQLNAAAQAKANDMAARNYWSHNTPEGNLPWIFVSAQNYAYQKLGENLATGFADERTTVNGWLSSPSHRDNMLDGTFSEVGFGFTNNGNYTSAMRGPMTIVVAFYGQPQAQAASSPLQSNSIPLAAGLETVAPSRAQVVLANTSVAKFGTVAAIAGIIAVIAIWVGRHALAVRRAVAYGESFVLRHPLMDIGFLVIVALLFLMTQTAGLIQ